MALSNSSGGATYDRSEFFTYHDSLPKEWREYLSHCNNQWDPKLMYQAYRYGIPLEDVKLKLASDGYNLYFGWMIQGWLSLKKKQQVSEADIALLRSYFQPQRKQQ